MKITDSLSLIAVFGSIFQNSHAESTNYTSTETDPFDDVVRIRDASNKSSGSAVFQGIERQFSTRFPLDRQSDVWNKLSTFESFKTDDRLFSTGSNGRKTLSKLHYMVLPIYWNGQMWASQKMDMNAINIAMQQTVNQYNSQSWNKFSLTYTLIPQTEHPLSSATRIFQTYSGARNILQNLGYTQYEDYDGIIIIYNKKGSGDFCCTGGKAVLGGFLATVSYSPSMGLLRHEIGHNLGHEHHNLNHYNYRNSRPDAPGITDGFDMMSGGNSYFRSDFGVASKWFFNWVGSENIVSMQPEGSTNACPNCKDSGTFTVKAFDQWDSPPSENDVFGIHIPIFTQYDEYWQNDLVYSYWLSYRTGVDGRLSDGLSIHLAWFEVETGMPFGAYFDSLNYDVVGGTTDKSDSELVANSCYHIDPAPFVMDRDLISANAVRPVVCVNSINKNSDITVSVYFLDPDEVMKPNQDIATYSTSCSTSSRTSETFTLDATKTNMIHVHSMGKDGQVTISLASTQGNSKAYFYDGYPYSPVNLGSNPSYGSMKRLWSSAFVQSECDTYNGATVVKISSNLAKPFALNEIELYDESGNNVVSDAECFASSSSEISNGDPNCLNDGNTGFIGESCNSYSGENVKGNFVFCVFPETRVSGIRIWPAKYRSAGSITYWQRNLNVEVYGTVEGLTSINDYKNVGMNGVAFKGLLGSVLFKGDFSASQKDPVYKTIALESLPYNDCSGSDNTTPASTTYSALFGEMYTVIPSIPSAPAGSKIQATFSCRNWSCLPNQYNANGKCNQCPPNFTSSGSITSILQCQPCPVNTYLSHPHATECVYKAGMVNTRPPSTAAPTSTPTNAPTASPTAAPTARPTSAPVQGSPTKKPTPPTTSPTHAPTTSPTASPRSSTKAPVIAKTPLPTPMPTASPTNAPTSNPTASPTSSPTSKPTASPTEIPTANSCDEVGGAKFFLKDFQGSPILKNCFWLAKKNASRKQSICSNTYTISPHQVAKNVCYSTCNTCHLLNVEESSTDKFLLKTKIKNGVEKPVKKTCQWLSKKGDSVKRRICNKNKSAFGFEPAKKVCPVTCDA